MNFEKYCYKNISKKIYNKNIGNPKTILFDMDGVLVNVSSSYRMAIKKTAEFYLRKTVTFAEIQEYKNRGGFNNDWDLTDAILRANDVIIDIKDIIDRFQFYYLGSYFNGFVQNEEWLLDLKILNKLAQEYKLGIVTGRPKEEAHYVLNRFGVKKYFSTVITLEDTPCPKRKPDPWGIQLALKNMNVIDAVYFGDTIDDMQAATAAGIIPVGVIESGSESDSSLIKYGAMSIIPHINKLMEILG